MELHPNVPIALAILRDTQNVRTSTTEDIARLLSEIQSSGIEMHELSIRRVPYGFQSDTVETFMVHQVEAGFAELLDTGVFQFFDSGLLVCIDIVYDELSMNPERMKKLLDAMKYSAFDLLVLVASISQRIPQTSRS